MSTAQTQGELPVAGATSRSLRPEQEHWLEEAFTYHPADGDQRQAYKQINDACEQLARTIMLNVPDCDVQVRALQGVQTVRMLANQGVALKGLNIPTLWGQPLLNQPPIRNLKEQARVGA